MSLEPFRFPFGRVHGPTPPSKPTGKSDVFVVGVYPSALHCAWFGPDGKRLCQALAIDIEPWSFWDGEDADERVRAIAANVPIRAGRLEPARPTWNGPSGRALTALYLEPLGSPRAWITDLHDIYYLSAGNAAALKKHYDPIATRLGLEPAHLPPRPAEVRPSKKRLARLEAELVESGATTVITLGNEPLSTLFDGQPRKLSRTEYGRPLTRRVFGRHEVTAIHLVHPRQAARLGTSSAAWAAAHDTWIGHARRVGGLSGLQNSVR